MLGVKVTVLRYVSDDPQPGIVEFQLEDANGHRWLFVDKTSVSAGQVWTRTRLSWRRPLPFVGGDGLRLLAQVLYMAAASNLTFFLTGYIFRHGWL